MKIDEIVRQAVRELGADVKELRQSDEDDLGELAASFDRLSEKADAIAVRLSRANDALAESSGDTPGDQGDGGSDEGEENEDRDADEEQQTA